MSNDNTIHQLNHLIQVNRDAEAGLISAADHVDNSELESLFTGYAKQHAAFARQLQAEVERLGGVIPESGIAESGTAGGLIHRGWIDLKSVLTGHSVTSLLSSCESGEESAEVAYHDASDDIATGQPHALIAKHHEQIIGFKTRLCRLAQETRDGLEYPANKQPR